EDQPARSQVFHRDFSRVLFVHAGQMVERHAVELHFEELVHWKTSACFRETHHDAINVTSTDDRWNVFDRTDHARIEHRHPKSCRIGINASNDLNPEIVAALEDFASEGNRG